ncbi:MAG: hypothetical protein ACLFPX_07370 [Candidatus Omnitrophota bacterium]
MTEPSEYYADHNIRQRMTEFLGGRSLETATAVYVAPCYPAFYYDRDQRNPVDMPEFWQAGLDTARSLWDHNSLIVHLDIEYVNFDYPAEPYLDPGRSLSLQKSVVSACRKYFRDLGITDMHVLSGRGHHFIWRIPLDSNPCLRLSEIGHVPEHVLSYYEHAVSPGGYTVSAELARSFAGLGLIMEFLGARIQSRAALSTPVPVTLSAVRVGPQQRGREVVAVDISEYGDPLNTRIIRIPFSAYSKHKRNSSIRGVMEEKGCPDIFSIPLQNITEEEGMCVMRDDQQVRGLAAASSLFIPESLEGTSALIDEYERSDRAGVHQWFYGCEPEPPEKWPETYDLQPLDIVPECIRYIMEHPNDCLLKPEKIRQVVLAFLALGWHPRHIAGLIRSKYERDHDWGRQWYLYDAATRADFYVRLFTAQIAVGEDDAPDFNCLSAKEKQCCFCQPGSCRLDRFRDSLLKRRDHERLACRPFNRLFL